ncbi:MAG TPA: ParA family protein [Terriglobales bacterium]|nr:ParA family protein [Terriglobales bacterium]
MHSRAFTISFVSGKGGVGKTSLATNLAWAMAKFGKVGFVDLDLQNQGATGLFSAVFPLRGCGVLSDLLGLSTCGQEDTVMVAPGLHFFPAVAPNSPVSYSGIAELINRGEIGTRLRIFLDHLQAQFDFDVVILDCHGGLDFLSLSAHRQSDRTVVMTEADTVTFNGTLELLEFYRSAESCEQPGSNSAETNGTGSLDFVVNRVPAKYRYDDLNGMYARLLARHSFGASVSSSILLYIPSEDFFADSYGEYPFAVSLAPKSVMFRKLNLLAVKLLPHDLVAKKLTATPSRLQYWTFRLMSRFSRKNREFMPFYALQLPGYRLSVEKKMIGRGMRNIQRIIITFALVSTLVSFWLIAALFTVMGGLAFPNFVNIFSNGFVVGVLALLSGAVVLYTMFTSTGLTAFYADKYQFQRRLWLALGKPLTGWQRLALMKLMILRVGTFIGPLLFVIIGLYVFALTFEMLLGALR